MSDVSPQERTVLFLADELFGAHGGTEGQLQLLIQNLPPGWHAMIWVLRDVDDLAYPAFPVPIRKLGLGSLKSPLTLKRIRALAKDVRAEGIDLIHGVLADTCIVAPMLGFFAGVPAVTSRRDQGYWQTPRIIESLRRVNRLADAIVVNAAAVGRRTIEIEHALPAQVYVIGNGHPEARFEAPADPGLRAQLGIPADAPVIGLLANFRPLKRVGDLLEAVALLGDKAAHVHVLLIGTGPGGEAHLEHAEALGLAGRVHIHGVIGNVVPVLKHLSIGVLCSKSEGLSNAIIEYMACGLPVVASNVGGNPELVTDGVNGSLYPCADIEKLAAALHALLADADRAARMGAAGRARFEERYTLVRMVTETIRCYESVLAARAPPHDVGLRWRLVTDLASLERMAPAWEALLRDGQFFCGPTWTLTWMRNAGARPCVPVAEDASGTLVGLLPLVWASKKTLVSCGEGMGADHLDVVAAPGRADEVARGVLRALEAVDWRGLDVRHVAEDAALRRAMRTSGLGFPYGERHATVAPYVRPGDDWAAFLGRRMRGRTRKTLRRKSRRFFEREGARVVRVTDPEHAAEALDRILDLHARRFAEEGLSTSFSGEAVRTFHVALSRRLAEEGRLRMLFLEAEDKTAAALYTFVQGRRLYYFQTGMDPEYAHGSPGLVLQGKLIEEDVIGAGLEECDFLDGEESYKFSWSTGVRHLYDLRVHPRTRRGRLAACLGGLGALTKSELKRLAASRRRGADA